jgi:hypothetical protein
MSTPERIAAQAEALADIGLDLIGVPLRPDGAPSRQPIYDVGHHVGRLAVVVQRLATDAARLEADEGIEHAPIRRPIPRSDARRAFMESEETVADLVSFFLIGDIVLDCLARSELSERSSGVGREWKDLVALVDTEPDGPMTSSVRALNLWLAIPRDKLVEHFNPQSLTLSGDLSLGRLKRPDDDGSTHRAAASILRSALGLPEDADADPFFAYAALLDAALDGASDLTFEQAGLVIHAVADAGYMATKPVPVILDELISVLRVYADRIMAHYRTRN